MDLFLSYRGGEDCRREVSSAGAIMTTRQQRWYYYQRGGDTRGTELVEGELEKGAEDAEGRGQ